MSNLSKMSDIFNSDINDTDILRKIPPKSYDFLVKIHIFLPQHYVYTLTCVAYVGNGKNDL